ncbi:hypothetical protein PHMEG_00031962, partial [Phytophthora megakarya]
MDHAADALRVQIQDLTVEFQRAKSRSEVARVNLAGSVKREKGYREANEDLKRDVTVARTAYADAERSITEQKALILRSVSTVLPEIKSSQIKKSEIKKPEIKTNPVKKAPIKTTRVWRVGIVTSQLKINQAKKARIATCQIKRKAPMTEDHKKDLDREGNGDDYDIGGGSDVEKPSDPDHPTLDEMMEKDRGAASSTPIPEPRYLSYEKDGSKKSGGTPASSDPAIKPKFKSKPRSTGDPKPSKDTGLEEEDQESEADTSADGDDDESLNDMLDVVIMLLLDVLELGALGILDPAMTPTVTTQATAVVFAPDNACIPGRQQTRQYNIADVEPWVIQRINTLTIMTMTLEVLSRALPFRPELIFPSHLPTSAVPRTGQYCSHLITGQNVRDLMVALPWNVLTGANIPEPMSFEITVDGRLGFLIERYSAVEFQDLIAYWEFTHRFPVPSSLIRSDPYLATFVVERKNRRSHAGARWKQILNLFLICDAGGLV